MNQFWISLFILWLATICGVYVYLIPSILRGKRKCPALRDGVRAATQITVLGLLVHHIIVPALCSGINFFFAG